MTKLIVAFLIFAIVSNKLKEVVVAYYRYQRSSLAGIRDKREWCLHMV
jgi:hypothetical protein